MILLFNLVYARRGNGSASVLFCVVLYLLQADLDIMGQEASEEIESACQEG